MFLKLSQTIFCNVVVQIYLTSAISEQMYTTAYDCIVYYLYIILYFVTSYSLDKTWPY